MHKRELKDARYIAVFLDARSCFFWSRWIRTYAFRRLKALPHVPPSFSAQVEQALTLWPVMPRLHVTIEYRTGQDFNESLCTRLGERFTFRVTHVLMALSGLTCLVLDPTSDQELAQHLGSRVPHVTFHCLKDFYQPVRSNDLIAALQPSLDEIGVFLSTGQMRCQKNLPPSLSLLQVAEKSALAYVPLIETPSTVFMHVLVYVIRESRFLTGRLECAK